MLSTLTKLLLFTWIENSLINIVSVGK